MSYCFIQCCIIQSSRIMTVNFLLNAHNMFFDDYSKFVHTIWHSGFRNQKGFKVMLNVKILNNDVIWLLELQCKSGSSHQSLFLLTQVHFTDNVWPHFRFNAKFVISVIPPCQQITTNFFTWHGSSMWHVTCKISLWSLCQNLDENKTTFKSNFNCDGKIICGMLSSLNSVHHYFNPSYWMPSRFRLLI